MNLCKTQAIFLILCFCVTSGLIIFHSQQSFASDAEIEIDKFLSLNEKDIDIGIAALTLAKGIHPDLDIKTYSEKIDALAAGARILTKGSTDPDYRIRALNTFLYKYVGIKYDESDPNAKKLQNRYLNGLLDTNMGSCVTMPILYLAIAQQLGYPVYPVSVPRHFILRYVDPKLKKQNIETTGGGGYVPDEEYTEVLQISKTGIKNGAYLRTMTYREFFADLVAEAAVDYGMRGDYIKAIRYMEKAIKVNPLSADISKASQTRDAKTSKKYRAKAVSYFKRADELGVTKISNSNYITKQKKAQKKFRKKQKEG
jgi:regulator of sirC expression with transglutaminase-like and TPR domain